MLAKFGLRAVKKIIRVNRTMAGIKVFISRFFNMSRL
jgi:hypothetical protein